VQNTKSIIGVCAGLIMLAVVSGAPAFASNQVVTSTADSGPGSLRAALSLATSGTDTITFNLTTYPATITLTSDELHITAPVTITGPGASKLTISGGGNFRVFENDGSSPVSISGLTIANGNGTLASPSPSNYPGEGGGIYTAGTMNLTGVTLTSNSANEGGAIGIGGGTVTLTNCTVTGNFAVTGTYTPEGGGIFNYGALTITGSTISNNTVSSTAGASGGGIFNANVGLTSVGVLNVTNSTISGNSAPQEGGGIFSESGTLTLTNSTVSGNSSYQGSGIENDGTGTVTGSTISANTGHGEGGGMFNNGTLTVTNSTISGNSTSNGAGVANGGTALSISFTTISGNTASSNGGGIVGAASVKNSIVANNGSGGNCYVFPPYMGTVNPPIISGGYNLSDDATCTTYFNQTGDLNGVAAGLYSGGLESNGGPTQTIALLSGSPAIDAIPASACTDWNGNMVTTDQIGTTRPQGPACDIGAFEYIEGTTPQTITFNPLSNQPLGTAPFTVSATALSGLVVTFNSQTTSICAVSGTNGTTVTLGAVGTCTIQATQDGNATYAAATPVDQSFQVTQAVLLGQSISFGTLSNQQIGAVPFVVSATSTSGLTVSFNSQTTSVCTVSGTNGTTVTMSAIGTCTIQATQAGNATYAPALPVNQSFQVTGVPQTISFGVLPNQLLGTAPFTVSATSTSGLTVSFASLTPGACTVSGATVTLVAGGLCTIQATQAGNATYAAAAAVDQSFTVESTAPTNYGTFTRVNQFDSYDDADQIKGGIMVPSTVDAAGSDIGENYALANFEPITLRTSNGSITVNSGPGVGVESASNQGTGSARALAFVTLNAPGVPFHVNAVLDGEFLSDCCGLPDGTLAAAAQIFVVNTTMFNALLANKSQAQIQQTFMGTPGTTAISPDQAIASVEATLAGMVYSNGSAFVSLNPNFEPYNTLLTEQLSTGLIDLQGAAQFTVVFETAAYSLVCCFSDDYGTGEVDFIHTLKPAANFFTDANGNLVVGITPAGSSPVPSPTPATLTLTPTTTSDLVGTPATMTATVTDTTGAALSGAIVTINVTSGPNAGATGGGVTGANGQVLLSYIGNRGAGTDYIQATSGTLTSSVVQQTWTVVPLKSGSACNGTYNGTFNGNVTITRGQKCVLVGGTVSGNITQNGGSLSIGNFTVKGNVQVSGSSTFSSSPYAVIDGNLQIQNVPAGEANSQVCGTTVQGNVQFQDNGAAVQIGSSSVACPGNIIDGNLEIQSNTGATTIDGNTVKGNLQDQSNSAATRVFSNTITGILQCQSDFAITGGGNTAAQKQGQCVAF
jgi:hypothetical protein